MRIRGIFHFLFIGLVLGCFFYPSRSLATLGESIDSIESDRVALSAVRRNSTAHTGYSVQEIESDSVTVREYVSPQGIFFGVAWTGLRHPDLTLLLGRYSSKYQEMLKKNPRKRGTRRYTIKSDRLVVEMGGHPRRLQGRAYDPTLVPAGVSPDEIL